MAAPKLQPEQQSALLTWLAAEYSEGLIFKWFADREWPALTSPTLSYYRKKYAADIDAVRAIRRSAAITTGLALKEERVERLKEHADELDAIKWLPDKNGRLWNEAAWRETLDDIAKEMGHRKQDATNLHIDMSQLNEEQLTRIAAGEDPLKVIGGR